MYFFCCKNQLVFKWYQSQNCIYPLHTTHNFCSIVSKKYCISFNIRLLSVRIAKWLECHAGEQGVAGSNPGGDIHHHFEFFAYFPLITARRIPY